MARMHDDEPDLDEALVRRLLRTSFPQWADLPLRPVPSAGTDNALYRLGADLAVRLPRVSWAVGDVDKEQRWLPRLAPHLPLAVPVPLGQGGPAHGYPWPWSVYRWLDGDDATRGGVDDQAEAAVDLARFVSALQGVDCTDGPRPGPSQRGVCLSVRDGLTRSAVAALDGVVDTGAVLRVWEAALRAPAWPGPPVWVHGDLTPGNLLVAGGRLSAVIDFGALNTGDPAVDLLPAWNWLLGAARDVYRAELQVDEATWARGRGWALSVALVALPYYRDTNPAIVAASRAVLDRVLADPSA